MWEGVCLELGHGKEHLPDHLPLSALQWDGNLRLWQYRQAEYFQDDMPESEKCSGAPTPVPCPSEAFSSPQEI